MNKVEIDKNYWVGSYCKSIHDVKFRKVKYFGVCVDDDTQCICVTEDGKYMVTYYDSMYEDKKTLINELLEYYNEAIEQKDKHIYSIIEELNRAETEKTSFCTIKDELELLLLDIENDEKIAELCGEKIINNESTSITTTINLYE
jgi:hypothetical protein